MLMAAEGGRRAHRSGGAVLLAVACYALAHGAARLLASGNLGEDDPRTLIAAQDFRLNYASELPLYNWLVHAARRVMGDGVLPFLVLKYALFIAVCWLLYRIALKVNGGRAWWAFIGVESLVLIYQISWRFHEGFTHAVGAMAGVALTFWLLTRALERGRWRDFAALGLAAGLTLLTVPMAWLFLGSLAVAVAVQPALRRRVARLPLAGTVAVASAVVAPVALAGGLAGVWSPAPAPSGASAMAVLHAVRDPLLYLSPLIVALPILFRGWLPAARAAAIAAPAASPGHAVERLIRDQSAIALAMLIAGAVLQPGTYPVHGLMPLFLLTTVWLVAQAAKVATDSEARRYARVLLAVTLVAFAARAANMVIQQPVCGICRWGIPYDGLAEALRARGFAAGTLLVDDPEIGGNLMRYLPQARVQLARGGVAVPATRPIAIVWGEGRRGAKAARTLAAALPPDLAPALATAERIAVPWAAQPWRSDARTTEWRLVILE